MKIHKGLDKWISLHPKVTKYLFIFLLGGTIYSCLRLIILESRITKINFNHPNVNYLGVNPNVKRLIGSKTTKLVVKKSKDYKKTSNYSSSVGPRKIILYEVSSGIKVKPDTFIKVSTPITISPSKDDSLVQFLLSKNQVKVITQDSLERIKEVDYNLDLEKYKYNYTPESGLTAKKRFMFEIQPYLSANYQILKKIPKLSAGISFKTKSLDYNIGGSLTSYEGINNPKITPDVEVQVTYKFKKWLK